MTKEPSTKAKPCMKCRLIMLFVSATALALGIFYGMNQQQAASQSAFAALQNQLKQSTAIPAGAKPVPAFALQTAQGEPFTQANLQDKWSLMFFGFTHCPDICPATLAHLRRVEQQLQAHPVVAGNTQVVFVSVDPERDTPEQLQRYVAYFSDNFTGVTAEHPQLRALTRSLGAIYQKVDNPDSPENYNVDHSAGIFVISPEQELRAVLSHPEATEQLTTDYLLLRQFAATERS